MEKYEYKIVLASAILTGAWIALGSAVVEYWTVRGGKKFKSNVWDDMEAAMMEVARAAERAKKLQEEAE